MKLFLSSLFVCLLLAACSRQPVRVASSMPPAPAPAEQARPVVTPPAPVARNRVVVDDKRASLDPDDRVDVDPDNIPLPPRKRVVRPDTRTNQTANIENQGAVGSVPLSGREAPEAPAEMPVVTLSKSSCYGDCDVYTLSYLPSGTATLTVSNGLMGKGTYRTELSSLDQREMGMRLDSLRGMELATLYPVSEEFPSDMQYTRLVLPDEEAGGRTVTVYFDAPAALQRFLDRLEALVENSNWKLMPAPRG